MVVNLHHAKSRRFGPPITKPERDSSCARHVETDTYPVKITVDFLVAAEAQKDDLVVL